MFRLSGTIIKDTKIVRDTSLCDETDRRRTEKVFGGLETICYKFDLGKPIWLDHNIADFRHHGKTRFFQDNFIEEINFDYLEIYVLEND